MRRGICILANLALLVAFLEAPFLHIHQHEATQQHPGAFLHFHLKTAHAFGKSAELRPLDPDDDALTENWVSVHPIVPNFSPSILAERCFIAELDQSGCICCRPVGYRSRSSAHIHKTSARPACLDHSLTWRYRCIS